MRALNLTTQVQKFLRKLPPKQARQVAEKIEKLRIDPLSNDSKLMRGSVADYRADQGEYRIIYRFDDEVLFKPKARTPVSATL